MGKETPAPFASSPFNTEIEDVFTRQVYSAKGAFMLAD